MRILTKRKTVMDYCIDRKRYIYFVADNWKNGFVFWLR